MLRAKPKQKAKVSMASAKNETATDASCRFIDKTHKERMGAGGTHTRDGQCESGELGSDACKECDVRLCPNDK